MINLHISLLSWLADVRFNYEITRDNRVKRENLTRMWNNWACTINQDTVRHGSGLRGTFGANQRETDAGAAASNGIVGSSLNTGNGWKSQNTLKRAIAGPDQSHGTFYARHNWRAHTEHGITRSIVVAGRTWRKHGTRETGQCYLGQYVCCVLTEITRRKDEWKEKESTR